MIASSSAVKLREYERIFTGSNQDKGYENPILGFVSNTTLQTFPTDKITYFHYPIAAPSGMLIDSDLVNSGAVAGTTPYRSDKIWKKMANYASTSIWGNSQPIGKQTGVWLCSWLSGNPADPDSVPVWKDRWFNPGYINAYTAFFVSNPASAIISDIDSQMIFDGGCLYRYFHVGNTHNGLVVNALTGTDNLKLHINDWSQTPVDNSIYENESYVENYDSNCVKQYKVDPARTSLDTCLNLNGTNQDCRVIYSSSYALTGNFTYSVWAYSNNWNEVQGNEILSKNYRGGWDLTYNNGFYTPVFFVCDRNNGNIIFLNSDGKILLTKTLPLTAKPVGAILDYDLYTWVLDNGNYNGAKHLYKIDYNGDIMDAIYFDVNETLKYVTIDGQNQLWVLATSSVSGFDSNLKCISTVAVAPSINYIDFDINGVFGINSNSFVFTTTGSTFVAPSTSVIITCDRYDNIWTLEGANTYVKRDPTNTTVLLSGDVGISPLVSGRNINFTNEYSDGTYKDYVWFLQEADQSISKYDIDGNLIKRIDLSNFNINPYVVSDFTGYHRNRKFNYARYNRMPQVQAEMTVRVSPTSTVDYVLTIPTTAIANNEWHMFTFTYDTSAMNFYMDAVLRDSINLNVSNNIYYKYENPLVIGANIGRLITLDDELDLNKLHFKGKLDDLRIYDIVLNNSDIKHIYLNKFDYHNIKWNMPTGDQSYLEEVERFFKFKMSGLKSPYFNIKLKGLNITDEATRVTIEDIIKNTIKKVTPAYSQLYQIVWE